MSSLCGIEKCNRNPRGLCDCCKQQLCLQHLTEHNASLLARVNPLVDEINLLSNRMQSLDCDQLLVHGRQELEQWRMKSHAIIDQFYQQKCDELEELLQGRISKRQENLNQIQKKVIVALDAREVTKQEIDSLTSNVHQLQQDIERSAYQINTRSITVDRRSIVIEKTLVNEFKLSNLPPRLTSIHASGGSYWSIAGNDRFLLMHIAPNLCLADKDGNIVQRVKWSYGAIWDMSWSPLLERFIILEQNQMFFVAENELRIENVNLQSTHRWLSCTCSERCLYLATKDIHSFIMEFQLMPKIELTREWKPPLTCAMDEVIHDLDYNRGNLAIMMMNSHTKSMRIDLKSLDQMNVLWSCPLNFVWIRDEMFRCCSIRSDEWLIADYQNSCLIQLSKDGKIKEKMHYKDKSVRVALLGQNRVIIRTIKAFNFHKLFNI